MKKYLWIIFMSIFLIAIILFSFIFHIWSAEKETKSQVVDKVKSRLPIVVTIEQVNSFAGDQVYYVIFAKDRVGDSLIVWANDQIIRYRYLKEFVTQDQIKKIVYNSEKNVTVKRISPGVIEQDRLIYEVLYEDREKRLGYSYYDLQSGAFLRKYRLGVTARN